MPTPTHVKFSGLIVRTPGMKHGTARDVYGYDGSTPMLSMDWLALENLGKSEERIQLVQILNGETAEFEVPLQANDYRLRGDVRLEPGSLEYVDGITYTPVKNVLWLNSDYRHVLLTWGAPAGSVAWLVMGT